MRKEGLGGLRSPTGKISHSKLVFFSLAIRKMRGKKIAHFQPRSYLFFYHLTPVVLRFRPVLRIPTAHIILCTCTFIAQKGTVKFRKLLCTLFISKTNATGDARLYPFLTGFKRVPTDK